MSRLVMLLALLVLAPAGAAMAQGAAPARPERASLAGLAAPGDSARADRAALAAAAAAVAAGAPRRLAAAEAPAGEAPDAALPDAPVFQPTEMKIGLFVTSLYDFDMVRRSYNAIFWLWMLHDNADYDPHASIEVVNAKTDSVRFPSTDTGRGTRWLQQKHFSLLAHDWDVRFFPFDRQRLRIEIEDAVQDDSQVRFVADAAHSSVNADIAVPGWHIEGFELATEEIRYASSFGSPTLETDSSYSRLVATISIRRDGSGMLVGLFLGSLVAVFLAMVTFLLDPKSMAGTRIGLSAAAVFAAIGNKSSINALLPPAPGITLADVVIASSFAAIIAAVLTVVLIEALRPRWPRLASGLNLAMAVATLLGVLGANAFMLVEAWQA